MFAIIGNTTVSADNIGVTFSIDITAATITVTTSTATTAITFLMGLSSFFDIATANREVLFSPTDLFLT